MRPGWTTVWEGGLKHHGADPFLIEVVSWTSRQKVLSSSDNVIVGVNMVTT